MVSDKKIHVFSLRDHELIQSTIIPGSDVYHRFSQIQFVKMNGHEEKVPVFLAVSVIDDEPETVYACPVNFDEKDNIQAFPIIKDN